MSHLKLHFALHTSHCTLHTPRCTLRTERFTFLTAFFTLHTSYFTFYTSQSTLHTSHCFLHAPHFTLHTPHFTLHSSRPTLHTPHFISSELFSPYPSSSLLMSSLLICHLSFHESLPSTTTKELACAVCQPGPCVRALCEAVAMLLSKNMTCARPRCNATSSKHFPHTSHCILHTSRSTLHTCTSFQLISSELFSSHFMSSHVSAKFFLAVFISSERNSAFLISPKLVSIHLVSSARQKAKDTDAFTQKNLYTILCTTKLAQSTSQYYFVLQGLHKIFPSTTLYHKACTKHFPVLLCTAKLAQSRSQYYFVLQGLHNAVPSTTVYYKGCKKYFPVLLCTTQLAQSTPQYYFVYTTKLAQSTFEYYFVLQSLHKALPSNTLYYKACTKDFPVLLCTTKLAQSTSQYYFVLLDDGWPESVEDQGLLLLVLRHDILQDNILKMYCRQTRQ